MQMPSSPLSPEVWMKDLFTSKAVMQGGVIRRKARDVDRYAGRARFLHELNRRGFRAVENAGQIVIFCNRGPVQWLTDPRPPPAVPLSFEESGPKSLKDFGAITPR